MKCWARRQFPVPQSNINLSCSRFPTASPENQTCGILWKKPCLISKAWGFAWIWPFANVVHSFSRQIKVCQFLSVKIEGLVDRRNTDMIWVDIFLSHAIIIQSYHSFITIFYHILSIKSVFISNHIIFSIQSHFHILIRVPSNHSHVLVQSSHHPCHFPGEASIRMSWPEMAMEHGGFHPWSHPNSWIIPLKNGWWLGVLYGKIMENPMNIPHAGPLDVLNRPRQSWSLELVFGRETQLVDVGWHVNTQWQLKHSQESLTWDRYYKGPLLLRSGHHPI